MRHVRPIGSLFFCVALALFALAPEREDRTPQDVTGSLWATRIARERAIAEASPEAWPRLEHGIPVVAHDLHVGGSRARMQVGAATLDIGLVSYGRAGAMHDAAASASPVIAGPDVEVVRGAGVTEWWRGLDSGLEHGVTLAESPPGSGPLQLDIDLGEEARGERISPDEIEIRARAGGERIGSYAHLVVTDADGRSIPAQLAVVDDRIRIEVRDDGARYPLVVDPLLATLEATLLVDRTTADRFGSSVAVSTDGSYILVGAPADDAAGTGAGSVRVSGIAVGSSAAMLIPPDQAPGDGFGTSVAISSDGSRAIVGAPTDDTAAGTDAGSARVFLRVDAVGATWVEEAMLTAAGAAPSDLFGTTVAMSADGSRVIVGATGDDTVAGADAGSARVFVRSGTTWTEEATFLGTGAFAFSYFGTAVAMSGDGLRVAIAPGSITLPIQVYGRSGTTWTAESSLGNSSSGRAGTRLAFDTTGTRAIVGTPAEAGTGTARVWVRNGMGFWFPEGVPLGTLLVADPLANSDSFGASVALSSDGLRAIVGAPFDDTAALTDSGRAHAFFWDGTQWTLEASWFGAAAGDNFGASVAMRGAATYAIVAAPLADVTAGPDTGTVRGFWRTGTTWTLDTSVGQPSTSDGVGAAAAVSADGSRVIVGMTGDDRIGLDFGSAHVFVRTGVTWTEEAALLPVGGISYERFGSSVAMSADGVRAIVGASSLQANDARVFVRSGSTWTEEARLTGSTAILSDRFGIAVSMSADGSRVAVGASRNDSSGATDGGAVWVFVRSGTSWTEEARLTAPDAAATDVLGSAVALDTTGSRLVVGATLDDGGAADQGSARIFARTGSAWAFEATLLASLGANGDNFGGAVAFDASAQRVIVGANSDDTGAGVDAGTASVFVRSGSTWTEEATLAAPFAGAFLGRSAVLTADGSRAVVGATGDPSLGPNTGAARFFVRTGSSWIEDDGARIAGEAAGVYAGWSVAVTPDGRRVVVGSFLATTLGGQGTGSVRVFTMGGTDGATCSTATSCASGNCVDGVCCDTACGGGVATDCQACGASRTGLAEGTCGVDTTTVGMACRPAAGACDVAETCDGTAPLCPADVLATAGSTCRAAAGGCDLAEVCAAGSPLCPGDAFAASGTVCRGAVELCDVAESCSGAGASCPGDAMVASGTLCRASVSECDVDDTCDGTTPSCIDVFAPSTRTCGDPPSGVCDAVNHCAATSRDCVEEFLSGVVCRPAIGACDLEEVCASSASCPPDGILASGVPCRASTDPACDPAESCDGVATSCPLDLTTCGPDAAVPTDAGASPDGGPLVADAGVGPDAGPPTAVVGCACRAGDHRRRPLASLLLLLLLPLVVRARRR